MAMAIGQHLLPFEADNWSEMFDAIVDGLEAGEKNSMLAIRLHDRCRLGSRCKGACRSKKSKTLRVSMGAECIETRGDNVYVCKS